MPLHSLGGPLQSRRPCSFTRQALIRRRYLADLADRRLVRAYWCASNWRNFTSRAETHAACRVALLDWTRPEISRLAAELRSGAVASWVGSSSSSDEPSP